MPLSRRYKDKDLRSVSKHKMSNKGQTSTQENELTRFAHCETH